MYTNLIYVSSRNSYLFEDTPQTITSFAFGSYTYEQFWQVALLVLVEYDGISTIMVVISLLHKLSCLSVVHERAVVAMLAVTQIFEAMVAEVVPLSIFM